MLAGYFAPLISPGADIALRRASMPRYRKWREIGQFLTEARQNDADAILLYARFCCIGSSLSMALIVIDKF
jgi:hypothetical protein